MRPGADDGRPVAGYRRPVRDAEHRGEVSAPTRGRATRGWIGPRDVLPAAFAAAAGIGITHGMATHGGPVCVRNGCTTYLGASAIGDVLLGLAVLAVLARRLAPRVALAFVAALVTADAISGQLAVPLLPALFVAFASVLRCGDRVASWATIAWAVLVWLPLSFGPSHFAAPVAWLIVIALGAEAVRTRRGRRAAQQRSREESALRRAEEERLRIARELHDVLAHSISLISVQSGVALHLLDERPEQARSALTIINDASGEALRELRSVLGVLRRVDEQAPREPAAGLQRLPELVAHAAAAGVEVQTHTEGTPRPLPASVDLAAYRIVQESLTNVARHASGGRATVSLGYGDRALTIEVCDDGPGVNVPRAEDPPAGSGNGILGMRERAAALGGELNAGRRGPGPGFRVRARLPYGGAS